ncbi:hypothetical protein CH267_12840 [Rhodococcus sp. 06-621-2]|nr:hypothetical protein CH267_12840 [Rhodococcus sp. 06-621-2]
MVASFVLSNAPTPLYLYWQSEWGVGSGAMTVVYSAYMAGLICTLSVAGSIADRYGRKIVLVPGLGAAAAASVLFLFATNIFWLLPARVLTGVAVGAALTAGLAATVDLAPGSRKRTAALIGSMSLVFGAGAGPLLSGVAASELRSPQTPAFSVVLILALVALVVAIRLPLRRRTDKSASPRGISWPSVPRNNRRHLLWGIATFAPGVTSTSFVLSLGPAVLADGLGHSEPLLPGLTAFVMFLFASVTQLALSKRSTRTHLLLSSLAAVASMTALVCSLTLWPSPIVFALAAVTAGAAQSFGQLAGITLIATHVVDNRRAEANAALNIAGYFPAGLLAVVTGFAVDALGLAPAVFAFAVIVGSSAAVSLVLVRRSTAQCSADSLSA